MIPLPPWGWWARQLSFRRPGLFRGSCTTPTSPSSSLSACTPRASGCAVAFWWSFGTFLFFIFFLFVSGFGCAPWPSTPLSGMRSSPSWTFGSPSTPGFGVWPPPWPASWPPVSGGWGGPPPPRARSWSRMSSLFFLLVWLNSGRNQGLGFTHSLHGFLYFFTRGVWLQTWWNKTSCYMIQFGINSTHKFQ